MTTPQEVFDLELALERAGGNRGLAREIFGMLVKELPDYLEGIKYHTQQRDTISLKETLHSLNGSLAYCGVPALKATAMKCETELRHIQPDEYEIMVNRVVDEIERLLADAEKYLQSLFAGT
jgi:HPt (histidine-containing phosphotransfer) domain-containing protein